MVCRWEQSSGQPPFSEIEVVARSLDARGCTHQARSLRTWQCHGRQHLIRKDKASLEGDVETWKALYA
jgi:hypothetical protein